jgi:hypothetical protein
MAMRCYVCDKKLNVFSDYKQIKVDGEKKTICAKCSREKEKKEVAELLQTSEGKQRVNVRGSTLIYTGVFELLLGILFMLLVGGLLWLLALCLFVIGCLSVYKGFSYKFRAKKSFK